MPVRFSFRPAHRLCMQFCDRLFCMGFNKYKWQSAYLVSQSSCREQNTSTVDVEDEGVSGMHVLRFGSFQSINESSLQEVQCLACASGLRCPTLAGAFGGRGTGECKICCQGLQGFTVVKSKRCCVVDSF